MLTVHRRNHWVPTNAALPTFEPIQHSNVTADEQVDESDHVFDVVSADEAETEGDEGTEVEEVAEGPDLHAVADLLYYGAFILLLGVPCLIGWFIVLRWLWNKTRGIVAERRSEKLTKGYDAVPTDDVA